MKQTRKTTALAGLGISALVIGATVPLAGWATAAGTDTTIKACADNRDGALRLVSGSSACSNREHYVTWNATGPAGPIGATGATGATGAAGATGAKGADGTPGAKGDKGDQGDKGDKGDKGDAGAAGSGGGSAPSAPVGFLKLDGAPGGSTVVGHEGEIELFGFGVGGTQTGSFSSGGGGGAGKVALHDISLVKTIDDASLPIFHDLTTGEHLKSAAIVLCDPTDCAGTTTASYLLTDVLVTSQNQDGSGQEQVALAYAKIVMQRGGSQVGWDVTKNEKI